MSSSLSLDWLWSSAAGASPSASGPAGAPGGGDGDAEAAARGRVSSGGLRRPPYLPSSPPRPQSRPRGSRWRAAAPRRTGTPHPSLLLRFRLLDSEAPVWRSGFKHQQSPLTLSLAPHPRPRPPPASGGEGEGTCGGLSCVCSAVLAASPNLTFLASLSRICCLGLGRGACWR